MILFIDTSSSEAVIATVDESSGEGREAHVSARSAQLFPSLRALAGQGDISRVVVVSGPGSFTGLRVGVSFGLGLAMGREIPIVPLPTLALQAARGDGPLTAVVEAGRGRFYHQAPGAPPGLGEPGEIPRAHPVVGRVSEQGRAALEAAGLALEPENRLRLVSQAAFRLLESFPEVPYGSLKLEYMQSFRARI